MRLLTITLAAALAVTAGCDKLRRPQGADALKDIDVIDDTNLSDVMLTVADPNEAVSYFQKAVNDNPDRIDVHRGLGTSLIRAGRASEAVSAYRKLITLEGATNDDRVDLADALIRTGDWDGAKKMLDSVPPTHETFKRYRLEAMIADSKQQWEKADSFYEIAAGLTTKPAGVLNNWGFSYLTRGDFRRAEQLFSQSIQADSSLFTAKNNLVLARSAQRNYDLPVVQMSQIERAQLLHTAGLAAVKQGDIAIAKGLLQEAIDTHPQHFEAASRALTALEANVTN